MFNKQNKLCFIILIPMLIMLTVHSMGGEALVVRVDNPDFSIKITEASYGDFDEDEHEDDVQVTFDLTLPATNGMKKVYVYFDLVMPSGYTFSQTFLIKTNRVNSIIRIFAYNTVIESGWFETQLEAVALGFQPSYSIDSYIFDPPRVGAGDPSYTIVLLR